MIRELLLALFLAAEPPEAKPQAASGGAFELRPSAVTSGGGYSAGGPFELEGAVGQPEASRRSSGAAFTLAGGIRLERQSAQLPGHVFYDGFE